MGKTTSVALLATRQQVCEAIRQGFLDANVATYLSTAKTNGYKPGSLANDESSASTPVGGINR